MSDQPRSSITIEDSFSDLDLVLEGSPALSEIETLGLQIQCLCSEVNLAVASLEKILHRVKYYREVISVEDIERIMRDLRYVTRDLGQ